MKNTQPDFIREILLIGNHLFILVTIHKSSHFFVIRKTVTDPFMKWCWSLLSCIISTKIPANCVLQGCPHNDRPFCFPFVPKISKSPLLATRTLERLVPSTTGQFVQQFVQANDKSNIEDPPCCPFVGGNPPVAKGTTMRKAFLCHITSSYNNRA